jgi:tRNA U34 5-methylaminomethyl-2-thiouridine-forming methyltransferase MnmC
MNKPTTQPADTADGSRTLYSERYGQTYASHHGALTESRHVFLEGAGVAERLRQGLETHVLEVGFGTGLNFFITADLALQNDTRLHYKALEHDLLDPEVIEGLDYQDFLKFPSLIEMYADAVRDLGGLDKREPPEGARQSSEDRGCVLWLSYLVTLELRLGDATRQPFKDGTFDAVYQDAFSPEANPELWTAFFLKRLHGALKPGGALSTYCVKGEVRRRLQSLGFDVQKRPGPPGGKREMLVATRRPD